MQKLQSQPQAVVEEVEVEETTSLLDTMVQGEEVPGLLDDVVANTFTRFPCPRCKSLNCHGSYVASGRPGEYADY